MRKRFIKSVDYTLIFVLNSDNKDTYHATVSIAFELNVNPKQIDLQTQLFLDFNANEIEEFYINGVMVTDVDHHWKDSKLMLQTELLKQRNFIEISYNANYRQLGSGLISLQDSPEEQYIYTMTQPFTSHHVYPCFDQLDIKGTFKVVVLAPEDWKVYSNQKGSESHELTNTAGPETKKRFSEILKYFNGHRVWSFKATSKLCPQSIGFAAGTFEEIKLQNEKVHKSIQVSIVVRKINSYSLKIESPELFDIIVNAIKHAEDFFKIPIAFPKLNFIFVPFLKYPALNLYSCPILNEEWLTSYRGNMIFNVKRSALIVQQIVGFYFGNYLNITWWNEAWLENSFNLFMSYLLLSRIIPKLTSDTTLKEPDDAWHVFTHQMEFSLLEDSLKDVRPVIFEAKDSRSLQQFNDPFYHIRGAVIWKQLYSLVGEDCFKKCFHNLIQGCLEGNLNLKKFIDAMEEAFSERRDIPLKQSLNKFFTTPTFDMSLFDFQKWVQEWLERPGVNEIEVIWEKDPRFSNMIKFKQVVPMNEDNIYRNHQIKVALLDNKGDVTKIKEVYLEDDKMTPLLLEDLNKMPSAVIMNYDGQAYVYSNLDNTSYDFLTGNIEIVNDSNILQILVSGMVRMVIQGKLNAKKYVFHVTKLLSAKKRSISAVLLHIILNSTHFVVEELVPSDYKTQLKLSVFDVLLEYMAVDTTAAIKSLVINNMHLFAESKDSADKLFNILEKYDFSASNERTDFINFFQVSKKLYLVTNRTDFYNEFIAFVRQSDQVSKYCKSIFDAMMKPDLKRLKIIFEEQEIGTTALGLLEGNRLVCKDINLGSWEDIVKKVLLEHQNYDIRTLNSLFPNTSAIDSLMDLINGIRRSSLDDEYIQIWIQHMTNKLKMRKMSYMSF